MKKMFLSFVLFLVAAYCHAKTYNVVDFGAKSDTVFLSTAAFQETIDKCSANGGGMVLVPAGNYKIGSIVLKSHICMYLEAGATIYGSTKLKDYIPQRTDYVSLRTQTSTIQLIYADKVSDVTIDGYGTIDGRGKCFKKLSYTDEGITRPHLLRFIHSSDITIRNITLRNSGCWMQHYLACDKVRIEGVRVFNRNNYNNDALDIDGCHEVTVQGMIADSDDDGITLKSTSPRLCENITISGCVISSHCNAIKLGTETNGGFKNINISGCVVKPSYNQSTHFYGRRNGTSAVSLEIVDGGRMENVNVSDIVVEGTESPIFIRLGNRARSYSDNINIDSVGTISGIHISNVIVNHAGPTGCSISGLEGHPVQDVTLSDITITQEGGQKRMSVPEDEKEADYPEATMWGVLPAKGFFIRHAKDVELRNVKIKVLKPDDRDDVVKVDVL